MIITMSIRLNNFDCALCRCKRSRNCTLSMVLSSSCICRVHKVGDRGLEHLQVGAVRTNSNIIDTLCTVLAVLGQGLPVPRTKIANRIHQGDGANRGACSKMYLMYVMYVACDTLHGLLLRGCLTGDKETICHLLAVCFNPQLCAFHTVTGWLWRRSPHSNEWAAFLHCDIVQSSNIFQCF